MPVLPLLAEMELCGLRMVPSKLNEMYTAITSKMNDLIHSGNNIAKRSFNMASPEQCADILYNFLKLPPPSSTSAKGKH